MTGRELTIGIPMEIDQIERVKEKEETGILGKIHLFQVEKEVKIMEAFKKNKT